MTDDPDTIHCCRIFVDDQARPQLWPVLCQCGWNEVFKSFDAALHIVTNLHRGIAMTVFGPLFVIDERP